MALVRILMRRWPVTVAGAVLTLGAVAVVYATTPPTYMASSQAMVLLPPTASSTESETSPFLYLPSGLIVLARSVAVVPDGPDFRRAMAQDGFDATYTVELQTGTPIVSFVVESANAERAIRTRDELMRRFGAELDRTQSEENVPERQFAKMRILEASRSASTVSGGRLRSTALAGLGVAVLTLGLVVLVDRRRSRTIPRRRRVPAAEPHDRADDVHSDEADIVPTPGGLNPDPAVTAEVEDRPPAVRPSSRIGVAPGEERTGARP